MSNEVHVDELQNTTKGAGWSEWVHIHSLYQGELFQWHAYIVALDLKHFTLHPTDPRHPTLNKIKCWRQQIHVHTSTKRMYVHERTSCSFDFCFASLFRLFLRAVLDSFSVCSALLSFPTPWGGSSSCCNTQQIQHKCLEINTIRLNMYTWRT